MASVRRVLVYGGCGALGRTCVQTFKANNWWVCNVDLSSCGDADANVCVPAGGDWRAQAEHVCQAVGAALDGHRLHAVVCVAGGFGMTNAAADDFVNVCDTMWKQSVWSSCVAAAVAAKHMADGGLLQLTGAKPAFGPTPAMIGYGMAKAAVHQLTDSLAAPGSGLPNGTVVPSERSITLDTPANRAGMPKADFSKWTPLQHVANYLLKWASGDDRPASGAKLILTTANGKTELQSAS